jgi:NAD(P)-dependent dehydrogenase (short-subunit alcohol dehydrogenase family)
LTFKGINLTFTELLLSRGCNVVLADLALRPEAKTLVSQYESSKPRAVFVETDVTSWPALERMFDVATAEFGRVDIVCPGAGVYEPLWSNFWLPPGSEQSRDAPDAGHYALLDINLTHPIRATQLAIARWLHPPAGQEKEKASPTTNPKRIIHIASVAAQVPVFRAPLYGASKFAIAGFVRSIAPLDEYGIRVCAVAPGVVKTPLWTDHPEKLGNVDETKDAWVTPQEVAEAMLSCLEDPAKIGGTVLEVGAGHTREVSVYNDPGPDTRPEAGLILSDGSFGDDQVHGWLADESVWRRPAS